MKAYCKLKKCKRFIRGVCGREEMLGVKYWGGVHDIQDDYICPILRWKNC